MVCFANAVSALRTNRSGFVRPASAQYPTLKTVMPEDRVLERDVMGSWPVRMENPFRYSKRHLKSSALL
jgi:hypothetical protein